MPWQWKPAEKTVNYIEVISIRKHGLCWYGGGGGGAVCKYMIVEVHLSLSIPLPSSFCPGRPISSPLGSVDILDQYTTVLHRRFALEQYSTQIFEHSGKICTQAKYITIYTGC